MIRTFGKLTAKPAGCGAQVYFPTLCRMNTETGDHRLLDGAGGGVRDLPLSIAAQFQTSYGHDGAHVTGTLQFVEFDDEGNNVSGRGWLLDDEFGQRHARLIAVGAMRGNSVDLTEVKARYEENLSEDEDWSYRIRFTEWNIGATTGVMTPAFADARAEIVASWIMTGERELTAALEELNDAEVQALLDGAEEIVAAAIAGEQPLVVNIDEWDFTVPAVVNAEEVPAELMASLTVQPYDAFFRPEPARLQKWVVDADGNVFGHLAAWGQQHDGLPGVTVPRPKDGYASFNKPGVLTERGIVSTGPVFALGGHRPSGGADDLAQAYGGIENAWCDVRITEGVFGPWCSGRVRPGVADEIVYAARASRVSGHWVGGRLKAIVSVNAEGFDVPGHADDDVDLAASFSFAIRDGELELVASLIGGADVDDSTSGAAPAIDAAFVQAQIDESLRRLGLLSAPLVAAAEGDEGDDAALLNARRQALLAAAADDDDDES